ncbi:hypothetical protein GYMLUDRAFT_264219 [Collybiopsis luxurians FD-317 M1]|uniref:NAD(P)-binding protein n=1 Tax=Collybiopsis luxurians FD-317 M1 TaxID=944289 RepID=A0A0D0BKI6_9AGAR|nr:hypothetical protein GYMLUDRAFT_264219 [Collybiopsis luxurians FD-317 M1]
MGHYISHNLPQKPTWSFDQIPDLTGQVIIVTGSNTGIGKVVAEQLLKHNAKVYMAVRSQEKAEAAIEELKEKTGKEAIFLKLDLSDLTTIRHTETKLHVLINNAGLFSPPIDQVTAQGFDMQFGVNTLGPFYFTQLLLPLLTATAETTPNKQVRVVNVSSYVHHFFPKLDFNTFKDSPARRKMRGILLYGQSKTAEFLNPALFPFGNILFSNELAKRYGEKGIVSISLHPGNVRSELGRHGPALVMSFLYWALLYPGELGGLGPLYAATAPECSEYSGKYLTAWARYDLEEPNPKIRDPDLAKELWAYMEEQVKDY